MSFTGEAHRKVCPPFHALGVSTMKLKYQYRTKKKTVEREYSYIPFRFIVAILITLFEIVAVIRDDCYPSADICEHGYVIPFGDGPHPLYKRRVGKSVIQNMLNSATEYMYMTTPYLIIDNDLCTSIENAALRGVDVRIITPNIPDKKSCLA